jgi:hypothetical protein
VREQMRQMQATTREVALAREAKRPGARRQPLTKGALFTSDEAIEELQKAKREKDEKIATKHANMQLKLHKRMEKKMQAAEKQASKLQPTAAGTQDGRRLDDSSDASDSDRSARRHPATRVR